MGPTEGQEAGSSTATTTATPTSEQNEACTACRKVKRKCLHDRDGTKCTRCARLSLECNYMQAKRGRKPGSTTTTSRKKAAIKKTSLASPSTSNDSKPPVPSASKAPPEPWALPSPNAASINLRDTSIPTSDSNPERTFRMSAIRDVAGTSSISSDSPGSHQSPNPTHAPGGFTFKKLIENRSVEPPSQAMADVFSEAGRDSAVVNSNARFFEDIVAGGVVPEEDVVQLFEFYFTHLNPMTSLLDPALHTPAYVRATSAFLFSAILTVAIRIAQPPLYPPSLKFVKHLFGQTMEHSIGTLETIQAIATLVFWADAVDSGMARRLSYAIRCAFELKLDKKGPRPLPEDPFAARLILNRERTWLHLCIADHRCSDQRLLPRLIPAEKVWADIVGWILEHVAVAPCPSEAGLAPLIGIGRLLGLYNALVTTREGELPNENLLDCLEAETQIWRSHWAGQNTTIPLDPSQKSLVRFCDHVFQFQIDECRLLLAVGGPIESFNPNRSRVVAFHNCIKSARAIIDVFRQEPFINLYQDSTWIGVASAAIWLVQNFSGMTHSDRQAAFKAIKQAQATCDEASTGTQSMAAYTARLFGHLLCRSGVTLSDGTENGSMQFVQPASLPRTSTEDVAPPVTSSTFGRSGSFVMASPASHFDTQWAGGGLAPVSGMDPSGGAFLHLMVPPQESLGDDFIYPTADDQLWQQLFPMYGEQNAA
ncbi:hypothetical protein T439DRAFT_327596 [Meredithblackwellia eburnea MCA 4105]